MTTCNQLGDVYECEKCGDVNVDVLVEGEN